MGRSLPWERRASQSCQARPEEAQELTSGTAEGGDFDHAAVRPSRDASLHRVVLVAVKVRVGIGIELGMGLGLGSSS